MEKPGMRTTFVKQDQSGDLLLQSESEYVFKDFTHEMSCSFLAKEEAYRFFWDSSFDGSARVYIGRSGEVITLRACRLSFSVGPAAEHVLQLSPDQWGKFQLAVAAANFWSLDRFSEQPAGLDGAQWSIEGRREGIYHAVHRWSPSDSVRELGEVFVGLAGAPLATVHLY